MSKVESPEGFAVRVHAARVAIKGNEMLGRPSPAWLHELVAEGERRERESADSQA